MPQDTTEPDLDAIETILSTLSGPDHARDDERLDRESEVLSRVQAEVNTLIGRSPDKPDEVQGRDQEALRRLLERINDALDANRDARRP